AGGLQRRCARRAHGRRAARAIARPAPLAGAMDRLRAPPRRARRRDADRSRPGHRPERSRATHRARGARHFGEHAGRRGASRCCGGRRVSEARALEGRRALVTGASRGIGRATAIALARAGASVAVGYSAHPEGAEAVVAALRAEHGVTAVALGADLADPHAASGLVGQTVQALGGIDIVVNNAGITRDNLAMRLTDDDWNAVLAVDLTAAFHICRAALRPMLRQRFGRVVNVSSVSGVIGNAGQANYAAAKAGLIGLTKSLAREVASRDITVNAVA